LRTALQLLRIKAQKRLHSRNKAENELINTYARAAGDCCCKGFQIVTATGMGASAALSAMKYVKRLK
jgi:thioredoxin reductase